MYEISKFNQILRYKNFWGSKTDSKTALLLVTSSIISMSSLVSVLGKVKRYD